MVKISVIIPVYNVEEYLKECLDSIINQTFKDIEIICVNDGSTDKSLEILGNYANNDSRIKILTQENKGLGAARNTGLNVACGDYIYFIDSDDYLELNALNELYGLAEEKFLDLIIFKLINFYHETGEEFEEPYHEMYVITDNLANKSFSYTELMQYFADLDITVYTKFFKKDLIENIRFDEELIFEDNLFAVDYIFDANKIFYYNKYLYHRRVRKNSIITSASKKHVDSLEVANRVINKVKEQGFSTIINDLVIKKISVLNYRLDSINKDYKDFFFKMIKLDFIDKKEEYSNLVLNDECKLIFNNIIKSDSYMEFSLRKEVFYANQEIFNLKTDLKRVNQKNEEMQQKLNEIYSSNSWKFTEPLRKIRNLKKI